MVRLKGILKFLYEIEVVTGLHIGGAKENVEIGGIDNPVIKLKNFKGLSDVPYIPGSSVKGKIRSLLELSLGKSSVCSCGDCDICKIFGTSGTTAKHPIRIRIFDFYPKDETIELWENYLEGAYTEIKAENTIDRLTSTVRRGGLRHMERVIPGSIFEGDIIFRIFDENEDKRLLDLFEEGIKLLQEDYLGGSGSRGYGRIKLNLRGVVYSSIKNKNGSIYVEKKALGPDNYRNAVFISEGSENA